VSKLKKQHDVNAYKFDNRTEEEFIKDLTKGLTNEVKAISCFREILEKSLVEKPEILYVGSEKEGEVQFDKIGVANVDLFPDYLLKYKNAQQRTRFNFIEVKICNPYSEYAYFKKSQLDQFNEINNVLILFIMGANTHKPMFILVSPQEIINLGITPETIYGKETYKANINLFNWEKFIAFKRDYSLLDKHYLR
jgi:hypothetical protein